MRPLLLPKLLPSTRIMERSGGLAQAKQVTIIQDKGRLTMLKVVLLSVISTGFALLAVVASAQSASGQASKGLTLRGRVESVSVKEIDQSSALIDIKLKMELVNVGVVPIILLQREPF